MTPGIVSYAQPIIPASFPIQTKETDTGIVMFTSCGGIL